MKKPLFINAVIGIKSIFRAPLQLAPAIPDGPAANPAFAVHDKLAPSDHPATCILGDLRQHASRRIRFAFRTARLLLNPRLRVHFGVDDLTPPGGDFRGRNRPASKAGQTKHEGEKMIHRVGTG